MCPQLALLAECFDHVLFVHGSGLPLHPAGARLGWASSYFDLPAAACLGHLSLCLEGHGLNRHGFAFVSQLSDLK